MRVTLAPSWRGTAVRCRTTTDRNARPCYFRPVTTATASPHTKGERTRQTIVDHGVATAYRIGLGRLTIGELATSTGLSKSGLYAHFGSKETLQLAVLDEAATRFTDAVIRPALQAPRGEPRLRALFDRWVQCGTDREPGVCLFVKAATELDEQPGPVRDRLAAHHRALIATIETVVRTSDGGFRADADGRQVAADLYGVMLSFYLSHRLLRDSAAEHHARTAFEALLAALAPAPPPTCPDHATGNRP